MLRGRERDGWMDGCKRDVWDDKGVCLWLPSVVHGEREEIISVRGKAVYGWWSD